MYLLVHYHVNPKHVQCDNLKFFSTRSKHTYIHYNIHGFKAFLKEWIGGILS